MLQKKKDIGTNVSRTLQSSQDAPSKNQQSSKLMQFLKKQAYYAQLTRDNLYF